MEFLVKILFALPVYQSVILTILLFFSGHSRPGNSRIIMGLFQLLMAIYFTFNFLYSLKAFEIVGMLYFLIITVILMLVPMFFLYIVSITTPGFRFLKSHLFHFMPALLITCLNTPYLFTSQSEKYDFISNGYTKLNTPLFNYLMIIYMVGIFIIFTLQLILYTIQSIKLYRNHKTYIENRFSYTENINLDWILILIISFAVLFVFNDILYLIGFRQHFVTQILYNLIMLSITLYAGYRGLLQRELIENSQTEIAQININSNENQLTDNSELSAISEEDPRSVLQKKETVFSERIETSKKYSGSALGEDQKRMLIEKLQYLILEEKIYINEKLSIEDIAIKLNTNTKYISQVINETYNKNFYNFINSYRIEEAKRLLISEENEKYSILGIAQSVGFVSKSTFNVAFKRMTGLTPSEFKSKMG